VNELDFQMPNDRIQPADEGLFSFFSISGVFERGDAIALFIQADKVAREVVMLVVFGHPFPEKALFAGMQLHSFAVI
jgi:hypothetical protein